MAQGPDLAFRALHPDQPFAQGTGVILAEPEGAGEFQPGLFGLLAEARQGRKHAPRKDIVADKVAAGAIAVEQFILDGDGLDHGPAAALQPLRDAGEIGRPVMLANRLEHLDGDDVVESAGGAAIILQLDVGGAVQPLGGEPVLGR